jgi:hypothetical protein
MTTTSIPAVSPRINARIQLAIGHVKTVLGDTPVAEMIRRELETARNFNFLGQDNGLARRVADQIIGLQESQVKLPDPKGST